MAGSANHDSHIRSRGFFRLPYSGRAFIRLHGRVPRFPFPVEVGIGIAIEDNSGMFIIGAFPGLTFRTGNGERETIGVA
jgi:hypothetical protein